MYLATSSNGSVDRSRRSWNRPCWSRESFCACSFSINCNTAGFFEHTGHCVSLSAKPRRQLLFESKNLLKEKQITHSSTYSWWKLSLHIKYIAGIVSGCWQSWHDVPRNSTGCSLNAWISVLCSIELVRYELTSCSSCLRKFGIELLK